MERNCSKRKIKAFIGIRFSVKYSQYKNTNFGYGCDEMPKKTFQREVKDAFEKGKFGSRLRKAKAHCNITNKEIVRRSIELGSTMSESTVCKSLKGHIKPNQERIALWGKILNVYPYWLMGYGSEERVLSNLYEQEQTRYLEEINQIFFKLHPDHQFLLLQIARELMTSNKNIKDKD